MLTYQQYLFLYISHFNQPDSPLMFNGYNPAFSRCYTAEGFAIVFSSKEPTSSFLYQKRLLPTSKSILHWETWLGMQKEGGEDWWSQKKWTSPSTQFYHAFICIITDATLLSLRVQVQCTLMANVIQPFLFYFNNKLFYFNNNSLSVNVWYYWKI